MSKCAEYGVDAETAGKLMKVAQMPWESASKALAGEREWVENAARYAPAALPALKSTAGGLFAGGGSSSGTAATSGAAGAAAIPALLGLGAGAAGVGAGYAIRKNVDTRDSRGNPVKVDDYLRSVGETAPGSRVSGGNWVLRNTGRAGRWIGNKISDLTYGGGVQALTPEQKAKQEWYAREYSRKIHSRNSDGSQYKVRAYPGS